MEPGRSLGGSDGTALRGQGRAGHRRGDRDRAGRRGAAGRRRRAGGGEPPAGAGPGRDARADRRGRRPGLRHGRRHARPGAGRGDGGRGGRPGGRLDCVVSNAAVNPFMAWDETSVDDFNLLFETNVRGTWVACTEAAKQMIREGHGGAICCVSSISAHVGAPGQTAYCGTKGAISMLAKALGRDLGEHGIRVNAVEPGWVKTDMSAPLTRGPGGAALLHRTGRAAPRRRSPRNWPPPSPGCCRPTPATSPRPRCWSTGASS